jgi:single-strand DNA-binding protein
MQLYYPFVGRVAAAPTSQGTGDKRVTKFTLIKNEYAGKDAQSGEAKERVVSIQFTAFRGKAEAIANHVNKGDQLIVSFRIENNRYEKDGEEIFGYNFIVDDFEFGAPGSLSRAKFPDQTQSSYPAYNSEDL